MRTGVGETELPTGTVTFMFTDVERSTTVLHELGDSRFAVVIGEHSDIIRDAITAHGGTDVGSEGDSHFAVFPDTLEAVGAAVQIQREMLVPAGESGPLRVRIGLHTGVAVVGGGDYVGVDVHLASRISDSAHGGQVVVSDVTSGLLEGQLPDGIETRELGKFRLAGFTEPAVIHQLVIAGFDNDFPALRAPPVESQLPRSLSDFVGRGEEISQGIAILEDHRLLTLTGPGGTGKTRLSLELARSVESRFEDGAFFVALAALTDPDLVPTTILETLRLKTAAAVEPIEHLLGYLSERNLLLVLDNFEQLAAGANYVADLLGAAPGLSIIVTSRAPLRVSGERELPVPPLEVPEVADIGKAGEFDGVRLFVNRAEAVQPTFALTNENVATVASIVRSLDGLPLAIELAASRLRTFTPELVLERLGNQMLAASSADLPKRQQTIVNAIGWSYDLLDEGGKRLFEQLSVFAGSFGLSEAESVVEGGVGVLDGIAELVEQSLLRNVVGSGEPRFRMLTVIREFAYAALVASDGDQVAHDRHSATYLQLAESADHGLLTSQRPEWLARLSIDHDNLRSAFDHAMSSGDVATALGFAGSLWRFWQMRGHLAEGRQRIERALGMASQTEPVLRARALIGLGGLRYWQGDWEAMLPPYREAVELARSDGTEEDVSEALYNFAFGVAYAGDLDGAEELFDESLEISDRIGRPIGVARAHWGIGNIAVFQEDWDRSVIANTKAIEGFSEIDAPFDLGWSWFMLGHTYLKMEEYDSAKAPFAKALSTFATVEDVSALALILEAIGVHTYLTSDVNLAHYFVGAAHRIKRDTGVNLGDVDLNQYEPLAEMEERRSGEALASFEEGYEASLDVVVAAAQQELAE